LQGESLKLRNRPVIIIGFNFDVRYKVSKDKQFKVMLAVVKKKPP
jgi:hypothetical protein